MSDIKGGKIEFRVDRHGNLHFVIGKASFADRALVENYAAALEEVIRLKPAAAKGRYLRKITVTTTMGPGILVDPSPHPRRWPKSSRKPPRRADSCWLAEPLCALPSRRACHDVGAPTARRENSAAAAASWHRPSGRPAGREPAIASIWRGGPALVS